MKGMKQKIIVLDPVWLLHGVILRNGTNTFNNLNYLFLDVIELKIGLFDGLQRMKRKIIFSESVRLHTKLFREIELMHFENSNYLFLDVI